MKANNTHFRSNVTPRHYPNQAAPGYFLRCFADNLLYGAGTMGLIVILFFMVIAP